MKNHKKIFLLLIGLCICILLYFAMQTYAKYVTSTKGNAEFTIASWNIKVNDLSIKNNTDISNKIVPVFPGTEHIAPNIIAPTAEGYFDLNFDFTDADVSFKYEITTSSAENSSVKDLVATGYSIDNGEKITFETYNSPISENIIHDSSTSTRTVRVYIMWDDDTESQTMTNEDDTLSTSSEAPALFNVNIAFTQITEQNLVESTDPIV